MRNDWGKYLFVTLVGVIAVTMALFVWSGGMSLVNLYREYLSQDLPDKKFNYADFTDRGPRSILSGYYAGRIGNSVFIWT